MSDPIITELKCVNLLDALYELQRREWEALSLPQPVRGQHIKLPDGRDDIKHRLWDEIRQDQWGGQQFTNDCFYRVPFEASEDNVPYLDDKSEDMAKLMEYCKDALNPDNCGFVFLLFDVSW